MKIEEFIAIIAQSVAQRMSMQPPKAVVVTRTDAETGAKSQQTTHLPQLIAEWVDQAKIQNELMAELTEELHKNHSIAKKVLKQHKDAADNDD